MSKKIFIAFAIEDIRYRDFLVGQSLNENSPFKFTDMSVKEPWSIEWKIKCRQRIKSCDGVVALISRNTIEASGEKFEIKCAYEENIPVMLMYISDDRSFEIPDVIKDKLINKWSWQNIKDFINKC